MQAWIVKHRYKDGVYRVEGGYGDQIRLFPKFFEEKRHADQLVERAGENWRVVEVEITEKE